MVQNFPHHQHLHKHYLALFLVSMKDNDHYDNHEGLGFEELDSGVNLGALKIL